VLTLEAKLHSMTYTHEKLCIPRCAQREMGKKLYVVNVVLYVSVISWECSHLRMEQVTVEANGTSKALHQAAWEDM